MSEPISIALLVADLVGIFVFALSGGVLAVRHRLDLFGVLVLACATAVTGGIVRDVLIGAIPPATLAAVGKQVRNQASFDPRNYGYAKLVSLIEAIGLFETRRKGQVVEVRDKRKA